MLFSLFLPFSAASLSSQNSACPSLNRTFESLLVLAIFASFPRLIPNDRGTRFHRKFQDSSVFAGRRIDGRVQMESLERTFEATSGSAIFAKTKGETQVAVCSSPNPRRKVFENSRHVRARGNSTKEKRKDRKKESGKRGSAGEREQKEIKERRRSIFLWTVEQPPCDYPGRGAYMSNLYSARSSVSKFEST